MKTTKTQTIAALLGQGVKQIAVKVECDGEGMPKQVLEVNGERGISDDPETLERIAAFLRELRNEAEKYAWPRTEVCVEHGYFKPGPAVQGRLALECAQCAQQVEEEHAALKVDGAEILPVPVPVPVLAIAPHPGPAPEPEKAA